MASATHRDGVQKHRSAPSEASPLLSRHDEYTETEMADLSNNIFTALWQETKVLTKYTLPIVGSNLLEFSLVIASVVSLGHISTTALAASTLGSMTASVTGFSIIHGFCSALDTMLPSAWTSPQPSLVGLWAQLVVMSIVMIPIATMWLNAETILLTLKQDPEVAHLAAVYLKYLSLGLPASILNVIARRYFQSQGLLTIPTQVILIVAPMNALLNYLLVWGPAPICLGFIGAPIATAASINLIAACYLTYGIYFVPRTAWQPISARSFTQLGVLVRLGLAGVGQTASEWWTWELVGLAASFLGPVSLASQSVLLVTASTAYQVPYSLSMAVSVRIGNLLGERRARLAGITAQASMLMGLAIAVVSGTIFVLFRHSWALLFNDDPDVAVLVASVLPLVALCQIFDGIAACTGGILRARGKQSIGALLNMTAYYLFGIPFGIWLAFSQHLGLAGLWIGLCGALVYVAGVGSVVSLRTDWQSEVHRALARVDADKQTQDSPITVV